MSIKEQEFAIVRGNSGTATDKIGITLRIEQEDGTPVDLTGRTYTFATGGGRLDKDMAGGGIEIVGNIVRISITKEDSLVYPVGHVEEYQLEQLADGYARTILKGRLLIKEGGSFNDR